MVYFLIRALNVLNSSISIFFIINGFRMLKKRSGGASRYRLVRSSKFVLDISATKMERKKNQLTTIPHTDTERVDIVLGDVSARTLQSCFTSVPFVSSVLHPCHPCFTGVTVAAAAAATATGVAATSG